MRPLPHDAWAERVALAGILREPELNAAAFSELAAGDFYLYPHRLVFGAAFELWASFREVSLADVYVEVRAAGHLADVGGLGHTSAAGWLADLYDADPTGANCLWAVSVLRRAAVRRMVVGRASEMLRDAYDGAMSTDEFLAMV